MTFDEDVAYFNAHVAELVTEHKGKIVLIKDQKVVDYYSNFVDAHKDALKRFGITDVLISEIGLGEPVNYIASVV